MRDAVLLVDPLAAFFRPALARFAPLVLDTTDVEVTLLPPLAKIAVVRSFTNSSDELVEAVLTLPPLAPQEIAFRLIVTIGGVECYAVAQPGKQARRAHDAAVADGRRAVLYELLDHGVQLIAIAGIEPGARVEVQIWSIKPLGRPEAGRATLAIPLSARHDAIMSALTDADALVTSPARHVARLSANPDAMQVFLTGQGDPHQITSRDPVIVDCAAPIALDVIPRDGETLDHCAVNVGEPGGWEITSDRGKETFRHPMNPNGRVTGNRSDWIFGTMSTANGDIRVTAPLASEGIAPNALALRAFAAACLVETATPQDPYEIRRIANILSRQTSLAFIGPTGELPDEIPMMRKLALPEMLSAEPVAPPLPPVAPPPPIFSEPPPAPQLPLKPDYDRHTPGAKPPRLDWLTWSSITLIALIAGCVLRMIDLPFYPLFGAFIVVSILATIHALPREGSRGRRRLPLLGLLVLPWIISLLSDITVTASWNIPLQYGLLVASLVLPLGIAPFMPKTRRSVLIFGILNLSITYFTTADSHIIRLSSGS